MINLCMTNSCEESLKAKELLDESGLLYKEISLFNSDSMHEALLKILSLVEGNFSSLIYANKRRYLNQLIGSRANLTINKLINMFLLNPYLLHQPIIFDEVTLQVGFDFNNLQSLVSKYS
ncbi:ArsC/Spx/MgsR family protein [Lactococcus lactis]|uniref:ArsC/Spx/MgsR family protein n=1 Tax=Lactococcus lactis TaxID=1358 RepID=UPI0032E445A0